MIITNYHGLPAPFVRAVTPKKSPSERRGEADISVTELIGPPRVKQLRELFWNYLEQDVTDMVWMLLGTIAHDILHRNSGCEFAERRLNMVVDGMTISGQVDLVRFEEKRIVTDYKLCSVYAYMSEKQEWEEQLNIYRMLLTENGEEEVDELQNVLIFKDWRQGDSERIEGYPKCKVLAVTQKLWPIAKTKAFVSGRVAAHKRVMPECDQLERWRHGDAWSVQKAGAARATRVFDSERSAKEFLAQLHSEGKKDMVIVPRPGKDTRCEGYCAVRVWCNHGRSLAGLPPIVDEEPV